MDNLEALRDIHLPQTIGSFPLGLGSVALLCLAIIFIFSLPFLRRLWLKNKKHYALKKLDLLNICDVASVSEMSKLLRRVCVLKYPDAVALKDKDWLTFLSTKTHQKINSNAANFLVFAPYMKKDTIVDKTDFDALKSFTRAFLEDNL